MSRIITVAAALLCLGGATSFVKSEGGTKSLALNLTLCTAAIALTSEVTDTLNNGAKKDKYAYLEQSLREQIEKLETSEQFNIKTLAETKRKNTELVAEVGLKSDTIAALERQVLIVKHDFQRKIDELDRKLELEDTRFTQIMILFKRALVEETRNRINNEYNSLNSSIIHKLELQDDDGNYKHADIHKINPFCLLPSALCLSC